MTNKEKFLKLVTEVDTKTIEEVKQRIKNRAMLRESQNIALKVLMKLDDLGWSQKRLAEELNVSQQQVSKICSGKENLTIETQIKLQSVLNIAILASYYDDKLDVTEEDILNFENVEAYVTTKASTEDYSDTNVIKVDFNKFEKYTPYKQG